MNADIGNKILNRRQELGITQLELAKRAGIAQSTLSNIEKGKKRPQFETMSAICQVLGFSVLDLLTYDEQQANIKFFEETMAAKGIAPEITPSGDMLQRLQAFERYIYDLYMAQTEA